jgi:hypothetical protein
VYHLGWHGVFAQVRRRDRPAQGVMESNAALDELGHHLVRPDIVPIFIPVLVPTYCIDAVFHAMAPYPAG